MGNEQGRLGEPTPAGIQSMDENLQKKFAKGIQYNSKWQKMKLSLLPPSLSLTHTHTVTHTLSHK